MKHEVKQVMDGGGTITMQANMKRRAVRVHHPVMRNCTFTMEDVTRRYPNPNGYPCEACNTRHIYKTWHFHLDSNGDTTVSEQVYERMKVVGFMEVLTATKEVIPRPFAIGLPQIDQRAQILIDDPPVSQPKVWTPDAVVSREHGVVKE